VQVLVWGLCFGALQQAFITVRGWLSLLRWQYLDYWMIIAASDHN